MKAQSKRFTGVFITTTLVFSLNATAHESGYSDDDVSRSRDDKENS